MSHYGPPGGQPSGQSQEPVAWPSESYDPPSDPWGAQASAPFDGSGSLTVYGDQAPPPNNASPELTTAPGYAPGTTVPVWTTPEPVPSKRKGNGLLIGVIVALAALLLGGGGIAVYLLRETPDTQAAQPSPGTTPTADQAAANPTAEPTVGDPNQSGEPPATAPGEEPSTKVRFVEVGQCVRNEGTQGQPKLVVTECGPQTYEVLARINGSTTGEADAKRKCSSVPGYTQWYFFNAALDELDFVLCLKQR